MAYVTWVTPATWDGKYPLPDLPAGKIWTGPYQNSEGTGYSCIGFAPKRIIPFPRSAKVRLVFPKPVPLSKPLFTETT